MAEHDALSRQRALIAAVSQSLGPSCAWHETHISLVLVAGGFAWKFKKAVRFDFLDFSTLDKRRFYCEEELRLNRRYAPDIYLDVVAVTGDAAHPVLGGDGEPLEYAVRMRAFEQSSLWSSRLAAALLERREIDAWAARLAQSHQEAAHSPADSGWCTPAALQAIADETLDLLVRLQPDDGRLAALKSWEYHERNMLHDAFMTRKTAGYIRECHGDLHCANILTIGAGVEAFDCIEFNESLRWIDVMNDIAFTCMDLRAKGFSRFAARLLSAYLEHTGDYEGLRVFGYYEAHRALIRCKVALLRAEQAGELSGESGPARAEASQYLSVATARIERPRPAILITHGFSGSGKSSVARAAVEALDGIQLRSDVERKRMHGLPALRKGESALYAGEVTARVYQRLHALARLVVQAGWTAVVDATFLMREQRAMFAALARELEVTYMILDTVADEDEMRRRIVQRRQMHADPSDAGLDVLQQQLASHDPFSPEELPHVVTIDTGRAFETRLAGAFAGL